MAGRTREESTLERVLLLLLPLALSCGAQQAWAQDQVLHPQWVREFLPPRPAWRADHLSHGQNPQVDGFYAIAAKGKSVFVASNATDSVTSLNTDSGEIQWRFYANGPVRYAPVISDDRKVYFGSDDGYLYCLNGSNGELIWKFNGAPNNLNSIGHGRVVSMWPVSTGPALGDGRIYFASGIWPMQTVYVHALDAKSGDVIWSWDFSDGAAGGREKVNPTIQGYMQLSSNRLVVPGGLILDAATGTTYEFRRGDRKKGTSTIVADGKQFTSSKEGTISCLAEGKVKTLQYARSTKAIPRAKDEWKEKAREIIKVLGLPADKLKADELRADQIEVTRNKREAKIVKTFLNICSDGGYALVLGVGSGQLIDALVQESSLDLIIVETDAKKVLALRRKYDDAGLYGSRVHVIRHDSRPAGLPAHMFNLITSESTQAFETKGRENYFSTIFKALHPYGGTIVLPLTDQQHNTFARQVKEAGLAGVELVRNTQKTTVRRVGSLPGAGQWTHTASDAGNSLFSSDDRVKPPFGVLWYGGDAAALPHFDRAASPHAPLVSGGRMFFQGPDRLFAVDVYTGRVIWQIKIEPHQTPYRKDGSPVGNYGWRKPLWYSIVALEDGIYLANGSQIPVLNPATGNHERTISLPAGHEYVKDIRCTGGILLAITPTSVLAWDRSRKSDKPLWSRSTGGGKSSGHRILERKNEVAGILRRRQRQGLPCSRSICRRIQASASCRQ
ncbi:MAG: PQQ-binding-like beta-propeller repeat protein [Fuerstiella sp.]